MSSPNDAIRDLAARAEERRVALRDGLAGRRADLPLRYWRQSAHFTTPAADAAMARKAVEGGTASVARILDRWAIRPADLAERLGLPTAQVEARLARPARAPLVMLDGEDAIAPGDAVAARGLAVAADVFVDADWSGGGAPTLRTFRPPGLNLDTTVRDLTTLLARLSERTGGDPAAYPLDAIVFPKLEHPEEVTFLHGLLDEVEAALGLPNGRIRVAYLIESGWAAAQLPAIAARAADRLCALIFGLADYSADLGLPEIRTDHPLADWVRAEIVNVAGGVGVPAIDGMTLAYPVADPALDDAANRLRFLDRMAFVYEDAVHARDLGMAGKWVGHPAQLLAVLLAFDDRYRSDTLEIEAAKLDTYAIALSEERGATMIAGVMSDRATDRHARALLRAATAVGRFDPERALALGAIDAGELSEARAAFAGVTGTPAA